MLQILVAHVLHSAANLSILQTGEGKQKDGGAARPDWDTPWGAAAVHDPRAFCVKTPRWGAAAVGKAARGGDGLAPPFVPGPVLGFVLRKCVSCRTVGFVRHGQSRISQYVPLPDFVDAHFGVVSIHPTELRCIACNSQPPSSVRRTGSSGNQIMVPAVPKYSNRTTT